MKSFTTKKKVAIEYKGKLMVVHFLENNGENKCATAKEFNIQPKQVCD